MMVHNDSLLSIYFGDARSGIMSEYLMEQHSQEELWNLSQIRNVKSQLHLDALVLLKQLHSTKGMIVSDALLPAVTSEKYEGDFLVTQRSLTGLGVYTADCLPIIFYDSYNRAIGICHAGWLGSVNKIAVATLARMQKDVGTHPDQVRIFFGPSAKVCCYEVQRPFKEGLKEYSSADELFIERGDKLFFDLPLFNKKLLERQGVKKEAFRLSYNLCTICNSSYCSNRRSKGGKERQLTIVALK